MPKGSRLTRAGKKPLYPLPLSLIAELIVNGATGSSGDTAVCSWPGRRRTAVKLLLATALDFAGTQAAASRGCSAVGADRRRQTQTDADRRRQTQTDADRRRQTQTDADRRRRRRRHRFNPAAAIDEQQQRQASRGDVRGRCCSTVVLTCRQTVCPVQCPLHSHLAKPEWACWEQPCMAILAATKSTDGGPATDFVCSLRLLLDETSPTAHRPLRLPSPLSPPSRGAAAHLAAVIASPLCATATVVGASAVGLSFGREDTLHTPSTKRKANPAREAMQSAAPTTSTISSTQAFGTPIQRPASSRVPVATRYSHDGRLQRRTVRRMTSDTTSFHSHGTMLNGYLAASEHGGVDQDRDIEPAATLSSRTSWIKRLSAISTSQHSSRNSSPGPMSPSVSCSNGSMAFSHDGSTAPIVGKRSPSPLPPNKLVKRSSSVRLPRDTPFQGSGSRLPSLRRPATSHQRSATMQHHAALMEITGENTSTDEAPLPMYKDNAHYAQFFTAKVSKEKALSKRKGPTGNTSSLKRIAPHDSHRPTLLLANSVAAGAEEFDETSSEGGDSLYFVSRPGTPMSITAVISANGDGQGIVENVASKRRPSTSADDEPKPRRSFSISDFLSPKQRLAKTPGAKLSRKPSKRVSSAPLPTMSRIASNTVLGETNAPHARRDLTDPIPARCEISTSAGLPETNNSHNGLPGGFSSSPLPAALSSQRNLDMANRTPGSERSSDIKPSASASANQIPPSPTIGQAGVRPSRHSVAPSEQASTLVGSDNEARGVGSGDEDDADLQSETVFDSLRTGATRSTSGARGPRIETIFDESPPSKIKVTGLRDLLPKGTFREQAVDGAPGQQSIAEEEESISTPVRTVRTIATDRTINDSPSLSRAHGAPLFPSLIPSSPPDMPKPLSLGTLEWDSRNEDDDASRWSFEEEQEEDSCSEFAHPTPATNIATPVSLGRHNPRVFGSGSSPKPSTPQHLIVDHGDRDARSSIFDWSELPTTDKSSGNRTPPRPRTVHGKKDADRRGSRSVGRRAPSGLHARSQSVPVVPDATGKRSTVVTNKFGTWGVGSKGVTEDWNDDFDFSDLHEDAAAEGATDSQRADSGTAMFVPKTIQEQQSNVLANIGLLREWGLLIEELKEQRIRAVSLGLLEGPNASMWEEVDAMIDLADQEAEHDGIPRLSPPSSPGFDEDAFDDVSSPSPNHGRRRRKSSFLASEELGSNLAQTNNQPNRPRRKSILPPNYGIFGPHSSPIPSTAKRSTRVTPPQSKPVTTRPRKDSEAKARSVIEALQKRRSTVEPVADVQLTPPAKKVPFDTATLRRIVPYVNTLTRKVKEALREAEGLYSSPSSSPQDPPFSKMFQADNDLATQMKLMTVM
ncbi:hypothetical protein BCR34DRAFT_590201 [Clohesyomyces aquaticus]|uniref:Uncharacterized protein n=1 Tax=Clohesyomyces aquaticus TaxID=1231657 RepID=A0A1Y1ZCC0_9PLEO|nr:hypothetical protein BCR34DRAFT_590201 [Clohesyomyces aquaticus]